MAKALGVLFVEYRATADKYLADLKQMAKDSKEFERTIAPLKNQLLSIGTGMSVVGGLVTTAFTAMATQAANYGDAIRDASIRTGQSSQTLSALKFEAEQTGTSFEAVTGGLAKLSRNALQAAQGSKQTEAAFKALGVSVKDSSGHLRSQGDILDDVRAKFSKMADGTTKSALAQQVFGKSAAQMTEFLNLDKDAAAAFTKQAEELGIVIGEDLTKAGDDFNDSLNVLKNAQLGLSNTIGVVLLPAMTKLVNMFSGAVVEIRKFAAAHPDLIRATFLLGAALTGAGGVLVGIAGVLAILPSLTAAFTILLGPVGIATTAITGFVAAMIAFPKFRGFVVDTLHDLIQTLGFFGSVLVDTGKALYEIGAGRPLVALKAFTGSVDRGFKAAADSGITFDSALKGVQDALNFTAPAMAKTGKSTEELGINLDDASDKAAKLKDKLAELANFLRGAETTFVAPISRFKDALILMEDSPIDQAFVRMKEAAIEAFLSVKVGLASIKLAPTVSDMEALSMALDSIGKSAAKNANDEAEAAAARRRDDAVRLENIEKQKQALKAATDSVKSSAGKIFDDMFIKGENVFSSLKNLLKGGALSLGRSIFEDIAGALLGPIKLAFDNFFKGLISGPIESLGKALSKSLTASLTGGAASKAVGGVAGSVGSVGGGAAGAAGSVGSGLLSGVISGGIAALGSIIGALITKGNAKRTEENTRETRDWLELQTNAWNPLFNQMVYYQKGLFEYFNGKGSTISGNGRIGPSAAADVQAQSSIGTINADFNFNPTLTFNVNGGDRSEMTVRDEMDQIMTALETGIRGYRERLMQIVRDSFNAPESTPVPTNS